MALTKIKTGSVSDSITLTTPDINGGTIDATLIGGTTPAAATFTTGTFNAGGTFGGDLTIEDNSPFINISNTGENAGGIKMYDSGGAAAQYFNLTYDSGASNTVGFDTGASGEYTFSVNTVEKMRISSSGGVGVGVSPTARLDIAGMAAGEVGLQITSARNDALTNGLAYINVTDSVAPFAALKINHAGTGPAIVALGDVGINTNTPAATLDVHQSGITVSNNQAFVASFIGDGYGTGQVCVSDSATLAVNNGGEIQFGGKYSGNTLTEWASVGGYKENGNNGNYSGYFAIKTRVHGGNQTEKMRVSADGELMVGTGSAGTVSGNNAMITIRRNSGNCGISYQAAGHPNDQFETYCAQNGRFTIENTNTSNGAYLQYNSGSGWTNVSDQRWKTDWTLLDDSSAKITALNVGKYHMLNGSKETIEGAKWDYGVKAQELFEVIPDAVDVPENPEDKYGVVPNIVFWHTVKALQEAITKIESLTARIEILEGA